MLQWRKMKKKTKQKVQSPESKTIYLLSIYLRKSGGGLGRVAYCFAATIAQLIYFVQFYN